MRHGAGNLEREKQRERKNQPAPVLEELEPDAIGMASVVSGGSVVVLPVGQAPNLDR
jgi:hypothetical protein